MVDGFYLLVGRFPGNVLRTDLSTKVFQVVSEFEVTETGAVTRLAPSDRWIGSAFSLSADAQTVAFLASDASTFPEVYVAPIAPAARAKRDQPPLKLTAVRRSLGEGGSAA